MNKPSFRWSFGKYELQKLQYSDRKLKLCSILFSFKIKNAFWLLDVELLLIL